MNSLSVVRWGILDRRERTNTKYDLFLTWLSPSFHILENSLFNFSNFRYIFCEPNLSGCVCNSSDDLCICYNYCVFLCCRLCISHRERRGEEFICSGVFNCTFSDSIFLGFSDTRHIWGHAFIKYCKQHYLFRNFNCRDFGFILLANFIQKISSI